MLVSSAPMYSNREYAISRRRLRAARAARGWRMGSGVAGAGGRAACGGGGSWSDTSRAGRPLPGRPRCSGRDRRGSGARCSRTTDAPRAWRATVPQRRRAGSARCHPPAAPSSMLIVLRALPQHAAANFAQPIPPSVVGNDRGEMVAGQLPDLGGEAAGAVREQDLALADLADVDQEVARRRMRGGVLVADLRSLVAERDPGRLAAPTAVDQLRV